MASGVVVAIFRLCLALPKIARLQNVCKILQDICKQQPFDVIVEHASIAFLDADAGV